MFTKMNTVEILHVCIMLTSSLWHPSYVILYMLYTACVEKTSLDLHGSFGKRYGGVAVYPGPMAP